MTSTENIFKPARQVGQYIEYDATDPHILEELRAMPKDRNFTVYKNVIYDVTDFKSKHPGGGVIELAFGRDSTELLECYHPQATKVQEVLEKFQVRKVAKPVEIYDNTFFRTLKKNINLKLTELGYNRHSFEFLAVTEVVVTVALYFFFTYMIAEVESKRTSFIFTILIGLISARMGMLMHMGGHGSVSSYSLLNSLTERCMELIGGSSIRWRFEHAYAHHIAPNELGMDTDCTIGDPIIRLHPGIKWKWYHVYQAPFIIFAMSTGITKWFFADISAFFKTIYSSKPQPISPDLKEWAILIFSKAFFVLIHVIWPAQKHGYLWGILTTLIHFTVTSHYLYQVFIVSHIQEGLVPKKYTHWAIKQVEGSADWGVGSHFANWVSVGLNHQVIHHLFPSMTHWVYPQLAPVVEQTCKDFGLKYYTYSSFGSAWMNMYNYLDRLGKNRVKFDPSKVL